MLVRLQKPAAAIQVCNFFDMNVYDTIVIVYLYFSFLGIASQISRIFVGTEVAHVLQLVGGNDGVHDSFNLLLGIP